MLEKQGGKGMDPPRGCTSYSVKANRFCRCCCCWWVLLLPPLSSSCGFPFLGSPQKHSLFSAIFHLTSGKKPSSLALLQYSLTTETPSTRCGSVIQFHVGINKGPAKQLAQAFIHQSATKTLEECSGRCNATFFHGGPIPTSLPKSTYLATKFCKT